MLPAGAEGSRRATGAAWLVLLALIAAVVGSVLASDLRSTPVYGDSASPAMQAVSLADGGHDLVHGAEDAAAYAELGWGDPVGLLFQIKGDGFAFAKPYLYSVALAAGLAITDDFLSGTLESGGTDRFESLGYFFVGRHTGLIVFMPVAVVLVVLAARHVRRPEVAAVLVGLVGYAAFYLLLFPNNDWGGGVSLGNRYFLQGSPMVLALVTVAPVPARALVKGALLASVAAVLLMAPHFWHPDTAISRMDRTSPLQRLLPFEANQSDAEFFRCDALGCERRG